MTVQEVLGWATALIDTLGLRPILFSFLIAVITIAVVRRLSDN